MKRILTAVILIPAVVCLVFLAPFWLFLGVTAAVAALAAWEFMGLAEHAGFHPPRPAVLVAIFALYAGSFEWPDRIAILLGILSLALLVYCTFSRAVERVMGDAAASVFCLFYVGLTLLALPSLREESNGPSVVVFLFFVVWAGDTAALYTGRYLGRRKLAPAISPQKTWAGAVGSVIASIVIAGGLLAAAFELEKWNSVLLSYPDEIWFWLVLAAIVNIAAQVGDLAESALKRSAGVKDSGNLLPGHGGMLDRIDALLLAAPVLWYAQVIRQMF
ncbi:MAG TPA: phosphatidate cytidylyltransferase [Terracidiphilus sp.]